jgi:stress-induced morphogen
MAMQQAEIETMIRDALVYEALKGRMGGELHALALTTSES